jgi:hypothetical protein
MHDFRAGSVINFVVIIGQVQPVFYQGETGAVQLAIGKVNHRLIDVDVGSRCGEQVIFLRLHPATNAYG